MLADVRLHSRPRPRKEQQADDKFREDVHPITASLKLEPNQALYATAMLRMIMGPMDSEGAVVGTYSRISFLLWSFVTIRRKSAGTPKVLEKA